MVHEIALTIKPTMKCNMKCRHCFNGDSLNGSEMLGIKNACQFIEAACREYSDVKVTFHGGEPTLAGNEFYRQVFDFQKQMTDKYGAKFSNNFTTNGILLNDGLTELLIANNALINISFDGPYNDFLRQKSGQVYERICRVKSMGGRVRAFCTVSRGSFEHLPEIYQWFNERKIDFKILPIEPRGYAAVDRELLMDTDKFISILTDTYRYWITDKACNIRFYTFEEFAALRRDTQFKPFWFNREIALNPDGKIYPFGRPNDVQFCLGEAADSFRLSVCFDSVEYNRMLEILGKLREKYCTDCESAGVCNGVCICMSYMYVQDDALLRYSCYRSNRIFRAVLAVNDEIMEDFRRGETEKYSDIIKRKFAGSQRTEG
jgi:uncharacterized protein